MNKLRKELQEMLAAAETDRPPALRRSLREEYLYATDLPQVAAEEEVSVFRRRAEKAGWQTEAEDGWILLDPPFTALQDAVNRGAYGCEAKACISLLWRHPEGRRPGQREIRMLAKAGEESPDAFEKACAALHREWAAALRQGEPLPEIPASVFGEGQET